MGPVFEHALVDALGLAQIGAAIGGNAVPEDVVMAALDHVDGVDLHIAEMLDRGRGRLRPLAERRRRVEPLGAQPDAAGLGRSGDGLRCAGIARQCSRIRAHVEIGESHAGRAVALLSACPAPPMLPVAISASQDALPRSGAWHR